MRAHTLIITKEAQCGNQVNTWSSLVMELLHKEAQGEIHASRRGAGQINMDME